MLSEIKGVGPVTEKKLRALEINQAADLLTRLPKGYMDMSVFVLPQDACDGDFCLFEGIVCRINRPVKRGKTEIFKAYATCENQKIILTWFHQNYAAKNLFEGRTYRFYGKLKRETAGLTIYNPLYEESDDVRSLSGIKPIYCTKGLLPQKTYRSLVREAFSFVTVNSIVDAAVEKKYGMIPLLDAYRELHFPTDFENRKAKERVSIEQLTRRICAFRIAQNRQLSHKERLYVKKIDYEPFFSKLPFSMNDSQMHALRRLEDVFSSAKKVNSVLCGDVGSGKTAVAIAAIYFVVKNGYRAVLMAPTEILAKQHYSFAEPIFSSLGIAVCFLSGSVKPSERNRLRLEIESGRYDVVIGTHSVLNVGENIPDLGFVVVDEQHRFGVAQRTALIDKGKAVDVLTLSATPIPRSMQLVAYGEVEYITIARRYASTVQTNVVPQEKRNDMWKYIAAECRNGTQAYVIAPKIYDAEGVECESVESLKNELKGYFEEERIGVLHGKMRGDEKQSVLDGFYSGAYHVLLSTTVVEVGIDVPNASIIAVTDAERFGLATLHQLRGRVGRNGQKAYCFLLSNKEPSEGLRTLCSCSDGFEIAEKDFETRGGGDILGLEQSGVGSICGLTYAALQKAKTIADEVRLSEVEKELASEIESFSLANVSLT